MVSSCGELVLDAHGAVLWIDEAGLLGTKTMRQVFELAEQIDADGRLRGDDWLRDRVESRVGSR